MKTCRNCIHYADNGNCENARSLYEGMEMAHNESCPSHEAQGYDWQLHKQKQYNREADPPYTVKPLPGQLNLF